MKDKEEDALTLFQAITQAYGNSATGWGDKGSDSSQHDWVRSMQSFYDHNWMAARCVNLPVDSATSKWRVSPISDRQDSLNFNLKQTVKDIAIKARIHGHCVVFADYKNHNTERLLVVEGMNVDDLQGFKIYGKDQIKYEKDKKRYVVNQRHKQPLYYHEGNAYKFTSPSWSLDRSKAVIMAASSAENNCRVLCDKNNIDVMKITNLLGELAKCGADENILQARMRLMSLTASNNSMHVIDKDLEQFDRHQITSDAVVKIYHALLSSVAHSANINVAIFSPQHATGLGSNNEIAMTQFYDTLIEIRNDLIAPIINYVDWHISQVEADRQWSWLPVRQLSLTDQEQVIRIYMSILEMEIPDAEIVAARYAVGKGLFYLTEQELKKI